MAGIDQDEDGTFDYAGESEMLWDTQEAIVDEKTGLCRVSCGRHGGHEWETEISND
jgi:hypothetical protein